MPRTAKCACGATSITVSGEPSIYGVCHCDNCKRRTGSAFGISSYFKKMDVLSQEGKTNVYAFHHTAQGNDQERHFCPNCGTTLFWYNSGLPQDIGIAAGCFVGELPGEPQLSVTHAKRYQWVSLPEFWRKVAE
ncbi:MAG: GFA family protein [Betaproteobacteria bacterium]|jgi:hypothetical protein